MKQNIEEREVFIDGKLFFIKADFKALEKQGYNLEEDEYLESKISLLKKISEGSDFICHTAQYPDDETKNHRPLNYVILPNKTKTIHIVNGDQLEALREREAKAKGNPTTELITQYTKSQVHTKVKSHVKDKWHNPNGPAYIEIDNAKCKSKGLSSSILDKKYFVNGAPKNRFSFATMMASEHQRHTQEIKMSFPENRL